QAGADIETIKNQLTQYSDEDLLTLGELMGNAAHQADYTYSYIRDEFIDEWLAKGQNQAALNRATGAFLDDYIRNIGGRKWGFIVYKNSLHGNNYYSASFRAVSGVKDVSVIAGKLGGGGHKPAAGAKFEANTVEDAIRKVQAVILEP
ncbi:hypothetical protein KW801_03905, partial [Candidatus Saccharibacteria bacterium]|nr:hypothetical protein [Candidatus Saccharibacteria bacterium]